MAAGARFKVGELKARPGVYARVSNDGESPSVGTSPKIGLALIQSNWGPVGKPQTIYSRQSEQLNRLVGTGKGAKVVKAFFNGGGAATQVIRVGNGGEVATATLGDEEGSLKVVTKHPTDRSFSIVIRDSVMGDEKDLFVVENERRLEEYRFEAGEDEAEKVVELLKDSAYVDAMKITEGALPSNTTVELEGGENPKVTPEDYTDAMVTGETIAWDVIYVDTSDIAVLNAVNAYTERRLDQGYRVWSVLGISTENSIEDRIKATQMFNSFQSYLVGMELEGGEGILSVEEVAAQVAGETVRGDYRRNLTRKPMSGIVDIPEKFTPEQYDSAALAGLITFDYNRNGQVVVDYAVNTLQNEDEEIDMGWRSLRRMRTRYELIDRIVNKVEQAIERGHDTDEDSLQHIITLGNTVILEMINEKGLKSGRMILDPENEPEGDSAWYTFENLVDLDGLNKVYIHFPLAYKR